MADDDTLPQYEHSAREKKAWFEQGYSTGAELRDVSLIDRLDTLTIMLDSVVRRFQADLDQENAALSVMTRDELRAFWQHHTTFCYFVFGVNREMLSTCDNESLLETCERVLRNEARFLRLFESHAVEWINVMGTCRKELPNEMWARVLFEVNKGGGNKLQRTAIETLLDRKDFTALASKAKWLEKINARLDAYECLCRACAECCGKACGCRFEHDTEYGCDAYDDDPNECDDSDHYSCWNCDENCACANH